MAGGNAAHWFQCRDPAINVRSYFYNRQLCLNPGPPVYEVEVLQNDLHSLYPAIAKPYGRIKNPLVAGNEWTLHIFGDSTVLNVLRWLDEEVNGSGFHQNKFTFATVPHVLRPASFGEIVFPYEEVNPTLLDWTRTTYTIHGKWDDDFSNFITLKLTPRPYERLEFLLTP